MTEFSNQQVRICTNKSCEVRFQGGRSDKRYCCGKCRSADYQQKNHDAIQAERELTRGNRDNEQILNALHNRLQGCRDYKGCVEVSNIILDAAGYNKKYTGKSGLIDFNGERVQSYLYHKVVLIAHPQKKNIHLIYKEYEV